MENKYNDPEYRWQHKEEMSKIMPYSQERKRLGLVVIDYQKLRQEYLSTIKENKVHNLNWNKFSRLVEEVPSSAMRSSDKKTGLQPKDFYHFERRDKCVCYLCETVSRHTQFHRVIPNGDVSDSNIVTLCEACHKLVHMALFCSGRWRYSLL